MLKKRSLKARIAIKIKRSRKQVFRRADFRKLAGYDQVGRALKELAREGILIKIAYGLYAKARASRITRMPMLAAPGGFDQVCKEALKRLKVRWKPSKQTTAYLQGSTQIPTTTTVLTETRFSRKIAFRNFELKTKRASR